MRALLCCLLMLVGGSAFAGRAEVHTEGADYYLVYNLPAPVYSVSMYGGVVAGYVESIEIYPQINPIPPVEPGTWYVRLNPGERRNQCRATYFCWPDLVLHCPDSIFQDGFQP